MRKCFKVLSEYGIVSKSAAAILFQLRLRRKVK